MSKVPFTTPVQFNGHAASRWDNALERVGGFLTLSGKRAVVTSIDFNGKINTSLSEGSTSRLAQVAKLACYVAMVAVPLFTSYYLFAIPVSLVLAYAALRSRYQIEAAKEINIEDEITKGIVLPEGTLKKLEDAVAKSDNLEDIVSMADTPNLQFKVFSKPEEAKEYWTKLIQMATKCIKEGGEVVNLPHAKLETLKLKDDEEVTVIIEQKDRPVVANLESELRKNRITKLNANKILSTPVEDILEQLTKFDDLGIDKVTVSVRTWNPIKAYFAKPRDITLAEVAAHVLDNIRQRVGSNIDNQTINLEASLHSFKGESTQINLQTNEGKLKKYRGLGENKEENKPAFIPRVLDAMKSAEFISEYTKNENGYTIQGKA